MEATKAQKRCIEDTFGVSSAVVAGAGSGKTETLTNRVVYALQHPERSGADDIDQILAITYTNKAAAELKSRIKAALERSATPDNGLSKQALKVDGAWISTIHGMCSRILKENAFTFGVDPAFSIMSDEVRSQVLDAAVEQVLHNPGGVVAPGRVAALFDEYRRSDVKSMVSQLVEKLSESGGSADEVFVLQPQADAVECLLMLVNCTQELLARFYEQASASRKGLGVTAATYCEKAEAAIRATLGLSADQDCAVAVASNDRVRQLAQEDPLQLARYAEMFPKPRSDAKPAKEPLQATGLLPLPSLAGCACSVGLAVGTSHLRTLVQLAELAKQQFDARKRMRGCLDNNDLLALVARALSDPANAAVARRYAEQFKLVMVDEFQDTNQMQVNMINLVAGGSSDAPSPKLCVVGDAQQSIYRFRNADLAVFQRHVESVHDTPDGKVVSLGDNFRSHGEILAFSKGVFSDVFEDSYLDLLHGRDEKHLAFHGAGADDEDASVPQRVNVKVFGAKGTASASERMAQSIARDLKVLADRGNRPGQMAVLLGKMTHADEYAQALQEVGLKCAITGGTVFKGSAEAKLVVKLCYALCDMHDTSALASVLTSDLFLLEAGDLLQLAHGGQGRTGGLSGLFAAYVKEGRLPEDVPAERLSPLLALALRVMGGAARQVGSRRLSDIVQDVLVESGWLHRLGDDAQVRAGNAFKAIRMIRDIEDESHVSALRLARQLEARIETLKEAPGVLSAEGDDFVRIMTIHASKGLSIPIVAVAEAEFSSVDRGKLKSVAVDGKTYLALGADASLAGLPSGGIVRGGLKAFGGKHDAFGSEAGCCALLQDAPGWEVPGPLRLATYSGAIRRLNELGDLEEHQRKLYVAYTRAKEALIVALKAFPKKGGAVREGGAIDAPHAIAEMLFGDEGASVFTDAGQAVLQLVDLHTAYDGKPEKDLDWKVRFEVIPAPDDAGEVQAEEELAAQDGQEPCGQDVEDAPDEGERAWFGMPEGGDEEWAGASRADDEPYRQQWSEGVFSASSLTSALHEHACDEEEDEPAAGDSQPAPGHPGLVFQEDDEPPAPATERGTAFHALCEWSASHWQAGQPLAMPSSARIEAMARLFKLNARQTAELPVLLQRWLASPQAQKVAGYAHVVPEQPFWVKLSDGERGRNPLVLQGFIDLLAYDCAGQGAAYVIDYKTGTRYDTDRKRRAAYGTQARCYAYALLSQGFQDVQLDFYFVDQPDNPVTRFPAEGEPAYTLEGLRALQQAEVLPVGD